MSELTYQRNVQRGVTGQTTGTCYLAAFDRITERSGIRPHTYEAYEQLRLDFEATGNEGSNYFQADINRRFLYLISVGYRELGVSTGRNVSYERAQSLETFQDKLIRLTHGGFRTAVTLDIEGQHTVGLLPAGNNRYYSLSTWSPFGDEPADVADIYNLLDQPPRTGARPDNSRRRVKIANMDVLPPES